ncbi:hypothetical protein [Salinimicrobium sp. WS361]|uniref:hypothetical protein n=1 Tax=Salinimicrobium sp. WS361 TaxID=3425123 RepID=UPI003D6E1EF2
MKNADFLIDWYHKENERKDSLNNSLNIPIGILTGLFILFFFLFKEFKLEKDFSLTLNIIFYIFLFLAIVAWIVVVYNLFGSYNNFFKGYTYQALPYPTILEKHYADLELFCEENKDELDENTTPETLYKDQFQDMLSGYLNVNINNNDLKASFLFTAKKYLIWCFILVLLSCFPFSYNYQKHNNTEKINKIEISNLEEILAILTLTKINEQKADTTTTATTEIYKRRKSADSAAAATSKNKSSKNKSSKNKSSKTR